jgi:asparagine synthase (glutamine-hydrolysing)
MVERRPIVSLTYGHENCRDVYYAKRIASACGSDHHWFNLPNGNWIKENADFHLELTEGFQSWIHAHGISTLVKARELIDVNLSGWDGGAVMGGYDTLDPLQIAPVDDIAFNIRLFSTFNQEYTWPSITEAEERFLYTNDRYQQLRGLAIDSLREEVNKYKNYRGDMRSEYFYFSNHLQQLTLYSIVFMRSHFDVRLPFLDYNFLNFVFSLPSEIRGAKRLFMAMIQNEMPKLAMIPYDKDGFLPTSKKFIRNSHAFYVRATRRLNKTFFPAKKERFTLYADYENYLRTDLRSWAEGILFRNEVGERNIFNVDFIKSILARHMSGNEMWTIGKIAPILTYEMMLRRLYD